MKFPLIYTPQGNMGAEHIDEHRRWYVSRHAPTLMGVGFISARMFDGEGTRWCNLYEIPDIGILSTPEYTQIRSNDPFRDKNISRFSNLNVNIYVQTTILDDHGAALERAPTMAGPVLTFFRFGWNGNDAALREWTHDSLFAACSKSARLRTVRLLERDHIHPEFKSTYPKFCACVEWATPGSPPAATLDAAANGLEAMASDISVETFTKRFGLLREGVLD